MSSFHHSLQFPSKPLVELNFDTPQRKRHLGGDDELSYRREALLGRGSFGVVLRARYKGRAVAVKLLRSGANESATNEANALPLQHENVVRIIKVCKVGAAVAVVMERYEGRCLQAVLEEATIDLGLLHRLRMLQDILSGLEYCHERGIVHLDLKPQNVLVVFEESGRKGFLCKICDFGSSIDLKKVESVKSVRITGSLRYMAPEVIKGTKITCSSDIFSFGILMWQLKFRQTPYAHIDCNESVAYQVVKNKVRPTACPSKLPSSSLKLSHNECFCLTSASALNGNSLPHAAFASAVVKQLSFDIGLSPRRLEDTKTFAVKVQNTRLESSELNGCGPPEEELLRQIFAPTSIKSQSRLFSELELNYDDLYTKCWHEDPSRRPTGQMVVTQLNEWLGETFASLK